MSVWKKIILNLFFSLLIALILFIFLEGILSLLSIGDLSEFTGWGFNPHCCGDLPANMVRLVKSDKAYLVETNSLGLRNPEVKMKPEKPRILALGDSFTFGPYLNNDQTWPFYLQDAFDSQVEVLNAGVSDYSIDYELAYFLEKGWKLTPELVILQFFSNDLTDLLPEKVKQRQPRFTKDNFLSKSVNFLRERSRLFGLLVKWKINRAEKKQSLQEEEIRTRFHKIKYKTSQNHPVFLKYQEEFEKMVQFVQEKNLAFMVVIFPALEQIENPSLNDPAQFILSLCQKYQLPCLDLQTTFLKIENPEALYLIPVDTHLSKEGNQLVAQQIKVFIEEKELPL